MVKLNIDENQQTAAKFEVLSIPTMILFQGGEPVKKVSGRTPRRSSSRSSSQPLRGWPPWARRSGQAVVSTRSE